MRVEDGTWPSDPGCQSRGDGSTPASATASSVSGQSQPRCRCVLQPPNAASTADEVRDARSPATTISVSCLRIEHSMPLGWTREGRGAGSVQDFPSTRVCSLAFGIERYVDCFATALTLNREQRIVRGSQRALVWRRHADRQALGGAKFAMPLYSCARFVP